MMVDNLPSRTELHRKGRKPKKRSRNSMINIILALFTLIPVGILLNVIFEFYTPNNSTSANDDNSNFSYETSNNSSEGKTNDPNKEVVIDEKDDEEEKVDSGISLKPDSSTNDKPETKPDAKPEEKPETNSEDNTETKPQKKKQW